MTVFSLLRADKKRWRRNSRRDQHGKIMTDDEAQISVNGNRGHHSITFSCFLYVCFCYRQGLYRMLIYYLQESQSKYALDESFHFFPLHVQVHFVI